MPLFPKHVPKFKPDAEVSPAIKSMSDAVRAKMDPEAIVMSANGEPIRYRKWDSDTGKYFSMSVESGKYSEKQILEDLDARMVEWKAANKVDTEQADEVVVKPGLYFDDETQEIVRIGKDGKPVSRKASQGPTIISKNVTRDDEALWKDTMQFRGRIKEGVLFRIGDVPKEKGSGLSEYADHLTDFDIDIDKGGGSLGDLVDIMSTYGGATPFQKSALAFMLRNKREFIDKTKVVIAPTLDSVDQPNLRGLYSANFGKDTPTIFIDERYSGRGFVKTMFHVAMHEIAHAGTVRDMLTKKASYEEWLRLYTAAKRGIENLPLRTPTDANMYGWTDPYEFVAEGFSTSSFRMLLKDIKVGPKNNQVSAYDQFLALAAKYFGVAGTAALTPEIVEEMEQIFKAKENTNGA